MKKHYKNDGIMKALTVIGGIVGLLSIILGLLNIPNYSYININLGLDAVITLIIGIVICILTLLTGLKPNNPIPFHWLMLLILAILLAVFNAGVWAVVCLVIAFLIGLIKYLLRNFNSFLILFLFFLLLNFCGFQKKRNNFFR